MVINKKQENIIWFVFFLVLSAVLLGFISGYLSEMFSEDVVMFTQPFSPYMFIYVLIGGILSLFCYLTSLDKKVEL